MAESPITPAQAALCAKHAASGLAALPDQKVGLARDFSRQVLPLNGLRHPPEAGTTGWFIWSGEELSQSPDFFMPVHVAHLDALAPEVVPFLALPPGWRFLIAGEYEDVWFDPSLIDQAD